MTCHCPRCENLAKVGTFLVIASVNLMTAFSVLPMPATEAQSLRYIFILSCFCDYIVYAKLNHNRLIVYKL